MCFGYVFFSHISTYLGKHVCANEYLNIENFHINMIFQPNLWQKKHLFKTVPIAI